MFKCYTLYRIQTDHGNYVYVSKEKESSVDRSVWLIQPYYI